MTRFGLAYPKLPERSALGLDPTTRQLDREMRQLCQQQGVTYLSSYAALCNEDGCLMRVGPEIESMMQWDVSHLTVRGSEYLASKLWP